LKKKVKFNDAHSVKKVLDRVGLRRFEQEKERKSKIRSWGDAAASSKSSEMIGYQNIRESKG
jgi:hypothetical protein